MNHIKVRIEGPEQKIFFFQFDPKQVLERAKPALAAKVGSALNHAVTITQLNGIDKQKDKIFLDTSEDCASAFAPLLEGGCLYVGIDKDRKRGRPAPAAQDDSKKTTKRKRAKKEKSSSSSSHAAAPVAAPAAAAAAAPIDVSGITLIEPTPSADVEMKSTKHKKNKKNKKKAPKAPKDPNKNVVKKQGNPGVKTEDTALAMLPKGSWSRVTPLTRASLRAISVEPDQALDASDVTFLSEAASGATTHAARDELIEDAQILIVAAKLTERAKTELSKVIALESHELAKPKSESNGNTEHAAQFADAILLDVPDATSFPSTLSSSHPSQQSATATTDGADGAESQKSKKKQKTKKHKSETAGAEKPKTKKSKKTKTDEAKVKESNLVNQLSKKQQKKVDPILLQELGNSKAKSVNETLIQKIEDRVWDELESDIAYAEQILKGLMILRVNLDFSINAAKNVDRLIETIREKAGMDPIELAPIKKKKKTRKSLSAAASTASDEIVDAHESHVTTSAKKASKKQKTKQKREHATSTVTSAVPETQPKPKAKSKAKAKAKAKATTASSSGSGSESATASDSEDM
jgi:hypothetical protein